MRLPPTTGALRVLLCAVTLAAGRGQAQSGTAAAGSAAPVRAQVAAPLADRALDPPCTIAPLAGPRIGSNLVALDVDAQWLAGDCFRWGHNGFPLFAPQAHLRSRASEILRNQIRSNVRILQIPIFLGALRPPAPAVTAGMPCSEGENYCATFHRNAVGAVFGCDHMLDIDNGGYVDPQFLARLGELIDLANSVSACGAQIEEIVFRFGGQDKYQLIRAPRGAMSLNLYPNLERAMETIIAFTKSRLGPRLQGTWDLAIEGAGLNTPWPHQRHPEVAEIVRRLITKFAPLLPNQWVVTMANQTYRPAFFAQTLEELAGVVTAYPPRTRWAIDVYGGAPQTTGQLLRETLTAIEALPQPIARDSEFMVVETWSESIPGESESTYADIMEHVYDYYMSYAPNAMVLRSIAAWPIARQFTAQLPGRPINYGPIFATFHEGFGGPAIVRQGVVPLGLARLVWLEGTGLGIDEPDMRKHLYLEILDGRGTRLTTFDGTLLLAHVNGFQQGVATDLTLVLPFYVVDQLLAAGALHARLCTRAGNGALLQQCSQIVRL